MAASFETDPDENVRTMLDRTRSRSSKSTLQAKRQEANPNVRRVYINQRILRIREEMKGLQKELQDAHAGAGPKGGKANQIKLYARERMVVLRDELKDLTAERKALLAKAGPPAKPAAG
jgi:hypothetical protein